MNCVPDIGIFSAQRCELRYYKTNRSQRLGPVSLSLSLPCVHASRLQLSLPPCSGLCQYRAPVSPHSALMSPLSTASGRLSSSAGEPRSSSRRLQESPGRPFMSRPRALDSRRLCRPPGLSVSLIRPVMAPRRLVTEPAALTVTAGGDSHGDTSPAPGPPVSRQKRRTAPRRR